MEATAAADWIDATHAARLLGVDPRAVRRLAESGRISRRDLPVKSKFRRADVERLAAAQQEQEPEPEPEEAPPCTPRSST